MFVIPLYLFVALSFAAVTILSSSWIMSLVSLWFTLSFLSVVFAYLTRTPDIFRKRQNGQIPFYIKWIFIPFLTSVSIYNYFARRADKVPNIQPIEPDLFLACRLFPSDIPLLKNSGVTAILDVTAEFGGLDWSSNQDNLHYLNIPVLDHQAPTPQDLKHALNWLDLRFANNDKVVIHCALGRGRSVWVTAACLLRRHPSWSVDQTLDFIKDRRDTANLNHYQKKKLNDLKINSVNDEPLSMYIIANPISGGSKWIENKEDILNTLTAKFSVTVHETSAKFSSAKLTRLALKQRADIIVAAGGDGTISEIANVLVNQNAITPLGILPMGTTNALAHVLLGNTSKIAPINVACNALISNFQTSMDVALCNNQAALLVIGAGLEEKMMSAAGRAEKNQRGQFAYIKGFRKALQANHSHSFHLHLDNQQIDGSKATDGRQTNEHQNPLNLTSLVVANASPFSSVLAQGGGEVSWNDGKLDVTWITDNENAIVNMTQLFLSAMTGEKFNLSDDIHHTRAKTIKIKSKRKFKYAIDGELFSAKELNICVLPNKLKIIADEQLV